MPPPRPDDGRATVKEMVLKRVWEAEIKFNEEAFETNGRMHYLGAETGRSHYGRQ